MITQDGRNALLRIMFAHQNPIAGWRLALYTDPSTEFTNYVGDRPLWTPFNMSNEIVTGQSESTVSNVSATIVALALHSTEIKGSTTDIKASYTELDSPINLEADKPFSAIYRVGW